MFNLFIIRIRYLNLLEIRKLDRLIISHRLHDRHIDSQTGSMLLLVLPFIGHMLVRNDWFVVDVVLLHGDVLHVDAGARLGFCDHRLYAFGELNDGGRRDWQRLGEHGGVGGNQGRFL